MTCDYIQRAFPVCSGLVSGNKVHEKMFYDQIEEIFESINNMEYQGNINRQLDQIAFLLQTEFGRKQIIRNLSLITMIVEKVTEINGKNSGKSQTTKGMCLKILTLI